MQTHRENSLKEDMMTSGLTDKEMTVNSTENDMLQTSYPKTNRSLTVLLYTHDNWAVIIPLKAVKHIHSMLAPNAYHRVTGINKRLYIGHNKHCNQPNYKINLQCIYTWQVYGYNAMPW